jgi:hypothetical protein
MWARSAAFAAALTYGYSLAFKCEVLYGGYVIADDIFIESGNVQVDYTAAIRRRGSINVVDNTGLLTPYNASDKLSPYGHEIRAYRGMRFIDGTTEYIPVGTLRIATTNSSKGLIQISAFDRSRSVSRARFEQTYTIASGTNYATAIHDLIDSRLPGLTYRFTTTGSTTPLIVFDQSSDPWASAQTMANAIGCDLYFDPLGVCVLELTSNPATAPVVSTYASGPTSMLLQATASMTDDPGYNGVVVDGEPPNGTPVHSVVYDNDPTSPTYYLGPYGKVPTFMRSTFITNQAQADGAGVAELLRNRGGTEQLKLKVLTDPCQEAGDLCYVNSPIERVDANYIAESFTIPFDASTSTDMTMRKRRSLA